MPLSYHSYHCAWYGHRSHIYLHCCTAMRKCFNPAAILLVVVTVKGLLLVPVVPLQVLEGLCPSGVLLQFVGPEVPAPLHGLVAEASDDSSVKMAFYKVIHTCFAIKL